MELQARVNSLSSLALAVLDSKEKVADREVARTANVTSASSSHVSVINGTNSEANVPFGSSPPNLSIQQAGQSAASSTSSMVIERGRRRGSSTLGTNMGRRKSWDQRFSGPIRRASQAIISLTNPGDGSSLHGECSRRDSRLVPETILMHSSLQRLPMKDFGAEVRASMDVDQFLQQAVLLLDIAETSLEGIVDRMLRKVGN